MSVASSFSEWRRAAVQPRLLILRTVPHAGWPLIVALIGINTALGLLPAAFILTMSTLVGRLPSSTAERHSYVELIWPLSAAAALFVTQQCFVALQGLFGEHVRRRVDGRIRDETIRTALRGASMAPMEETETLNALNEVTRLFDASVNTPGKACAGLLALLARYVRLIALLVLVATATRSVLAALVLGTATMYLRYAHRGGLRKYSSVYRQIAGLSRRTRYLRELASGGEAAKEMRIFGLLDWLKEHFARSHWAARGAVAARRREVYYRPYLVCAPIVLILGSTAFAWMARDAVAERVPLMEFTLGFQAAVAALLLGEFYAESDVQTQYGMQALLALDEVKRRVERAETPRPRASTPVPDQLPARSLRFEDVAFQYGDSQRSILEGLNLELAVGRCTAIVGANGAGKTTLVKLLTRLYAPTRGRVLADGIDIAHLDAAAWRRQVSVIFQDFVRYELSVADNVAFGAAHVPRDGALIEEVLQQAGLLDVFRRMPRGIDTILSRAESGGTELSGGQWQRIAIARALYALRGGARILVLDEPTSALDVRAELAFFDRFVAMTRGATSLLISHRFSTVRRADHVVVLDGGRVVEQGGHAELMAARGRYARLFRLQAERFTES
ncbi:MAG TPA: ATP-binding cassette domain-containing protein [Polyangiaceae bacterium]|jgi:ATP-binding cassette subfamily B protein|nr:ATP-binding cassette domain-containing protein [Polyangiaceae bacterium]